MISIEHTLTIVTSDVSSWDIPEVKIRAYLFCALDRVWELKVWFKRGCVDLLRDA
ncbi:unnamed protein product [Sphenostylis stenocarpa]|uniref:Uncharacterized protein n=1 Tax=Sphenostylis stenocarpa TaxID=92480 RepID=A0AA86SRZ7_9FABA|nr:unnamed protein product [Sphenostylis stenocarpa]